MVSKKEVIEGVIEIEGTFLELVRERPSGEFKNFRSVLVCLLLGKPRKNAHHYCGKHYDCISVKLPIYW